MQYTETTLTADDGCARFMRSWLPEGEVRAALYLAHGMAEHGGRYERLAGQLTARGYAVHANDHRGHGRTVAAGDERGHFADDNGWNIVLADTAEMVRWVRDQHPGARVGYFGHSMGSQIGQHFIQLHGELVDAAVFSGTAGKPPPIAKIGKVVARIERLRLGRRGRSRLIDRMTFQDFNKKFGKTRTDFDWLSRDPAEVDAYIEDPDCGFLCSVQLWIDLMQAMDVFTADDNQARTPSGMPIYLFSGDKDPVGEMGRSVSGLAEDYRRAGVTDVSLRLYPDGRHEMLNETNRGEVVTELLAWLDAKL